MVYLQVDHVEDNDVDLFKFDDLFRALKYLSEEKIIEGWLISDSCQAVTTEFEPEDYTYMKIDI